MRLGALLGPIVDGGESRALAEQARALQGAGFSSLWSAQALGRGFLISDPFIALAVAGAVTSDVELGTAVLQVPLYHPADLAHRIFSLMQTSGDRLLLGVGAGSTQDDFAAYDRDYGTRFATFTSSIAELRRLFADPSGDGYNLAPWSNVATGPPLLLGTWGKGVERAANDFDGWIASGLHRTPDEVVAAIGRYRAGGGTRAIVSTLQVRADTDLGELGERLNRFADAGFDDAVVMLMPGGPSPEAVRALVD